MNSTLDKALVAAVIAALGFLGKQLFEIALKWIDRDKKRQLRLHQLNALLKSSKAVVEIQHVNRTRLHGLITGDRDGKPGSTRDMVTDDALFAGQFLILAGKTDLSADQKQQLELHAILRGSTQFAQRQINLALLKWLRADTFYRVQKGGSQWRRLAKKLNMLEAHLLVWEAKYRVWIPEHPERCLSYVNDTERHGVPFPKHLDELVQYFAGEKAFPPPVEPGEDDANSPRAG